MNKHIIPVKDWCKKAHYSIDDVSKDIIEYLSFTYQNTSIIKSILEKALSSLNELDMDGEVWVDMPDYEGLYMISNKGRIKNVPRIMNKGTRLEYISKERILRPSISKDGYMRVSLFKNGKKKQIGVHRLVAIAFIPNNGFLCDVNHKDENKLNNSVDNLEWCSKEYNTKYGTRTERVSKCVLQYTKDGRFIREFKSVRDASRALNIPPPNIRDCAHNKHVIKDGREYVCRSAGGYVWRYKEQANETE